MIFELSLTDLDRKLIIKKDPIINLISVYRENKTSFGHNWSHNWWSRVEVFLVFFITVTIRVL